MYLESGWTSKDDIKKIGARAVLLQKGWTSKMIDDELTSEDALIFFQTIPSFEDRQMKLMASAIAKALGG